MTGFLPLDTVEITDAADAVESVLRAGLDPERQPERTVTSVPGGQLLFMPASAGPYAGAKLISLAPANPASGIPLVQGIYLLMDGTTLSPLALFDGAALTTLRTPAVSALGVRALATPDAAHLVLFGTGPQALAHALAIAAVRPVTRVTVVARNPDRAGAVLAGCGEAGLHAELGSPDSVSRADIVACCTSSREPLFDGALVPTHGTVVAIGSHSPDAREVDRTLVERSTVVVESRESAKREAGDLILAGHDIATATNLADLVHGKVGVPADRPRLFKTVGMAWEDLAIACRAWERRSAAA